MIYKPIPKSVILETNWEKERGRLKETWKMTVKREMTGFKNRIVKVRKEKGASSLQFPCALYNEGHYANK